MGQDCQRSLQAICDPEGTAAIIRKKKAQRACINKYTQLFDDIRECFDANAVDDAKESWAILRHYDAEVRKKGLTEGSFLTEMQEHREWPELQRKRQELEEKYERFFLA
eukprot:GEMP01044729.1.p1 GENE.GEMP01044729.1~~GEMP01044729.1.p1  ORF type:complete len:122 (+),score=18.76 GEMP01044729.1:40-366(+)